MIRSGLCSVSFRDLSVGQVADLAADAGLHCIEWGSDVHVPAGDVAAARSARKATRAAGLEVASYGSYLRCDGTADSVAEEAAALLDSARELGAPRVRIWAGRRGSRETSPEQRRMLVSRIRETAVAAADADVELGLEWHGGTLTDEIDSTLQLLNEVDHPAVRTYWQPHQDQPRAAAIRDLRTSLPHVSTLHVFSWWPAARRLPLAERAELWRDAFEIVRVHDRDHDALLEFVPGDDPASLAREAETLHALLVPSPGAS
ncbi:MULTISPECIES: sugar phosphate isomerase/epimerase family protein [unclassified Brachybacterium]|uniref:sugar phosphate isomerase/epimerase family protein n=1 Tax=unclassified Brachybacterium TaxID=2623841 RepID=UPI003615CA0D